MTDLQKADSAAKLNGLNGWTVRRLGVEGKITVFRHGAAVRYDPEEIRAYMLEQGAAKPVLARARMKK